MPTKAELRLVVGTGFVDVNIRLVKDDEDFNHDPSDISYEYITGDGVRFKIFDEYSTGGPYSESFDKYTFASVPSIEDFLHRLEHSSFREVDGSVYAELGEEIKARYFQKFLLIPDHL